MGIGCKKSFEITCGIRKNTSLCKIYNILR